MVCGQSPEGFSGSRIETLERDAENARIATDLIQCDHPIEAVEDGILDAFGHDRRGHLLRAHDQLGHIFAADAAQQHIAEEIEQVVAQVGTLLPRAASTAAVM